MGWVGLVAFLQVGVLVNFRHVFVPLNRVVFVQFSFGLERVGLGWVAFFAVFLQVSFTLSIFNSAKLNLCRVWGCVGSDRVI